MHQKYAMAFILAAASPLMAQVDDEPPFSNDFASGSAIPAMPVIENLDDHPPLCGGKAPLEKSSTGHIVKAPYLCDGKIEVRENSEGQPTEIDYFCDKADATTAVEIMEKHSYMLDYEIFNSERIYVLHLPGYSPLEVIRRILDADLIIEDLVLDSSSAVFMILSNECQGVKMYWDLWLYNLPGKTCRRDHDMKLVRNDTYTEGETVIVPECAEHPGDRIKFNRIYDELKAIEKACRAPGGAKKPTAKKHDAGIIDVGLYIDGKSGDISTLTLNGPPGDYYSGPKKLEKKSEVKKVKKCLEKKIPDIPKGLLFFKHLSMVALYYELIFNGSPGPGKDPHG